MAANNPRHAWNWQSAWPAPAKLNLFLHVVGRRADGYHLLQTAFRFIDRCDILRFSPRQDGQIVLATPLPGVSPEDDLTVRAARRLRQAAGVALGVEISLDKRLPLGGGLGGGSSDAATVLLALNHLWQLGLPNTRLREIGLALGADVPVFVAGRNAFAEGVGEELTPLELPPACYLVVEPPAHVPTAAIFSAPGLPRDTPPISLARWRPGIGHNDLEETACALFPAVAQARALLRQTAPHAMMTGSGACLFAEFSTPEAAEAARRQLPERWRAWTANGLAAHPLADLADGA